MPRAHTDDAVQPVHTGDRAVLLLLAGLAVLLVARIIALRFNATDLFFDEAQYWSWSEEPAFGYYSKPPLIAWIIAGATAVCGASEFCIRLPSPLLHTVTAGVLFLVGRRLYDARTGLLAGLGYATLPGVSLSSGIISTDVPLLLFWATGLLGFVALIDTRAWWPALLVGFSLGLGLNAKYAMAYFVLAVAVYLAVTPDRRWLLRDTRLWAALAIGIVLILPNVVWNIQNGFATVAHTADNANWGGRLINPGKMLEFFGAQFGVMGPVLFASLLVISVRAVRTGLAEPDRMLLSFALPVLVIVTVQAFISRAHANWAAVSYVPAVVLVMATMAREDARRWLMASFTLHACIVLLLMAATAAAGRFALPGGADPFARTLGWQALAEETRRHLETARQAGRPFGAVLADERDVTAELLYYMRGERTPILAWREGRRPKDHYELTRPFEPGSPEPVLLVSLKKDPSEITGAFGTVEHIVTRDLPAGTKTRTVSFLRLSGVRSR